MIRSLLIANRGEIAVRIARTAREMGIEPLGVYAERDARALHVRRMSRAASLGDGSPLDTYLSIPRVIDAARELGAEAVHPGYGFLSENADFARAVADAGMIWIGPPASAIEEMGDKLRARARMREAGVPVVPGSDETAASDHDLFISAAQLGFPLLVKASAGGGGKGMSRVDRPEELPAALAQARRVGQAAFGSDRVYLERLFERPRHIEFQIFADRHGHVLHLFERECSVQRRHQKVVEETPSPALDGPLREAMGRAAVDAARAAGYEGAGTVEFLLDEEGHFYFLEVNTRLQVEHAITEATLGLDLVASQIAVASGETLPTEWLDGRLEPRGHAIELRLYAEDPIDFLPSAGKILVWQEPGGPGVRVDAGVEQDSEVALDYDPLLAKLIVSGANRDRAIARARRALSELVVLGVQTNAPLLQTILGLPDFLSGSYSTTLLIEAPTISRSPVPDAAWIAAALELGSAPTPAAAAEHGIVDPWDDTAGWRPSA